MTKTNLWLDIGVFTGFLVAMNPALTGIAIHEWFSLALAVALVVHLLLHWQWVTAVVLRFFRRLFHTSRLKFIVDVLLFTVFTAVIMSGIMISRSLTSVFGFSLNASHLWRFVHSASADVSLVLVGLHFALNWNCVVAMVKRYIFSPLASIGGRAVTSQPAPVKVPKD
ncbi:MAG: DUF4405 domain-containing protein [Anaerolineae bacterium]|nr:DUF4405 domain-containing protein [Anaerolineae bacterium]